MKKKAVETNGGNLITNYTVRSPKDVQYKSFKDKEKSTIKSKKQTKQDYHESSQQLQANLSSKTEVINSDNQFQIVQQKRIEESCLQLIMIAPLDTTFYRGAKKKIEALLKNYSKGQLIKFILQNAKFSGGVNNLSILQKIDDDQFWIEIAPKILQHSIDQRKQKNVDPQNKSKLLAQQSPDIYDINKHVLVHIPETKYQRNEIPEFLPTDDIYPQRWGILRSSQNLEIKMHYKLSKDDHQTQVQGSLKDKSQHTEGLQQYEQYLVQGYLIQDEGFQQRYKYDMIIDFANKSIGGGILTRGAVQEEILFCIFPELIASLCICSQLTQYQAIIIYNAERFSTYEGYSDKFKYIGPFQQEDNQIGPFQSVVIAIDALDFKNQFKQSLQYTPFYIDRQLIKFLNGIQGADYQADEQMPVCTGKWGCGAFGGNLYCKFLIQWIGCSVANKEMRFMCQTQQQVKELTILVKFLKQFNTLQILEAMEQYTNYFGSDSSIQISFIEFIKKYFC